MSIIIPRSVWKPRYANGFRVIGTDEWVSAGKETWLHHSVTDAPSVDATLEQDCAHMRHIESIGQNAYGGGISYTVVVMPSGRAFEGHSLDRQGSHTYGRNNRSRAICMAGNYEVNEPGPKILGAVAAVLREWGCELDGGHRDVYATACPGQHAYARIGNINEAARRGTPIEGDDDVSAADVWNHPVQVVHGDGTTHQANAGDVLRHLELGEQITRDQIKDRVLAVESKVSSIIGLLNTVVAKLDAISTGGVSEARIGEIAKNAVADDLRDGS